MSLKQKTLKGFKWSFIDIIANKGITFLIGIVLARLLTPSEFGLIGMTMVFINFSQVFVDGGFGQALVRKQDCTDDDYSTVFYTNILIGFGLFVLIFSCAGFIAEFFNEPKLKLIIQVVSTGIVIKSFSLIQSVILIKKIDFKTQTKISVITAIISGSIGIYMAYSGFGVWSLVAKFLLGFGLSTLLLWIFGSWKPKLTFSRNSFTELFSFGSRLVASSIINKVYENLYLLLIGKFYSAASLGFYTRANQFKEVFSKNFTMVIIRVSYPSLATLQDKPKELLDHYRTLIKTSMFIVFILSFGLISIAKPLVLLLIGDKWLPSVLFFQLLSVASIFYPLQEINKNMLKVRGKSDLIMKFEMIMKSISIPLIIVAVYFGIIQLIMAIILISILSYILISYFSSKTIDYNLVFQVKDISLSFVLVLISACLSYIPSLFLNLPNLYLISTQIIVYVVVLFSFFKIFKVEELILLLKIISNIIKRKKIN